MAMLRAAISSLLLLALLGAAARKHPDDDHRKQPGRCMWHDFVQHKAVLAWEFQCQPHRHMVRDRDKAIAGVEALLTRLSADPRSGVTFIPDSRWMAIFREHTFMLTSRHGHPLHPQPGHAHDRPFPWDGVGFLRLRSYRLLTPAGAYVPTAQPGMADLTFKMKKVDPDTGPGELQLPQLVGSAKLTAKLENDIHCDHNRTTMSPLYKPVSQGLNISRVANVAEYFPNLAQVAMLDPEEQLPFGHDVHRAKIVWTVLFAGVVGEANLVVKYNTSFDDAAAGRAPKNGELSLRIRRQVAQQTGTEGEQALVRALHALADAMQAFRDAGWDGKTPPLRRGGRSSDGGSSDGGSGGGGVLQVQQGSSMAAAVAAATAPGDPAAASLAAVAHGRGAALLGGLRQAAARVRQALLLPPGAAGDAGALAAGEQVGDERAAADEGFDYDEPVWQQVASAAEQPAEVAPEEVQQLQGGGAAAYMAW